MAIASDAYFSNQASVGLGGSTSGTFNKFDLHATPKYALGFKVEQADGTIYRYSHMGAVTGPGLVVSQDVSETSVVDTDNVVIAPASAVAVQDETVKPGAIGSHYVQITLAAVTANMFRGGKFITTDGTGKAYTYDILGNTATDNPATGDFRLALAQAIVVALDTTTDMAIMGNQYSNLEAATLATDEFPSGVTCSSFTAALPYGWIQTKGIVAVLQDGTVALGDAVTIGSTAGSVATSTVFTSPVFGFCTDPGDTTGYGTFRIDLE